MSESWVLKDVCLFQAKFATKAVLITEGAFRFVILQGVLMILDCKHWIRCSIH